MPIYDYHCDHCGHAFSAVQRFADDRIAVCPSCGQPPRRLLSNPALVFRGSGWYKTDSRRPEKKDTADKPAAIGTDASTAPDGKDGTDGKIGKDKDASAAPAPATGERAPAAGSAAVPAKKPEKAAPASS